MKFEPHWKSPSSTWTRLKDAARKNRKTPTEAEALLWHSLRNGKVGGHRFRRQHAVGPYIVDFFCSHACLVVDVDGPIHDQMQDRDKIRDDFMRGLGLHVIRVSNQRVIENPAAVL